MAENSEASEVENVVPQTCEILWEQDSDGKVVFKGLSCETDADTELAYRAMDRAKEFIVMKKPVNKAE